MHGLFACMVFCVSYSVLLKHWIRPSHAPLLTMSSDGVASPEQEKWERVRANPLVQVVDLERAHKQFFEIQGFRGIDALVGTIKGSGMGWSSSAKVFNFTAWSLFISFVCGLC